MNDTLYAYTHALDLEGARLALSNQYAQMRYTPLPLSGRMSVPVHCKAAAEGVFTFQIYYIQNVQARGIIILVGCSGEVVVGSSQAQRE